MSKTTAFWWALVCGSAGTVFLLFHIIPCFVPLAIAFACFGGVWLSKRHRDQRWIEQGKAVRRATMKQLSAPEVTSKGTSRLFVPPPIDNNR